MAKKVKLIMRISLILLRSKITSSTGFKKTKLQLANTEPIKLIRWPTCRDKLRRKESEERFLTKNYVD